MFNAGCELEVGRGLSSVHWDELLEDGRICPALVTDDSHHPGFDSDHAWTWIRADRTPESVLDALRTGRFYGSTGPLIHDVEVRDGDVIVRCSPARSVTLLTGRTSGTAVNAGRLGYRHGAEILEVTSDDHIVAARLDLPGNAPFARLEVVDPRAVARGRIPYGRSRSRASGTGRRARRARADVVRPARDRRRRDWRGDRRARRP